jgi:predicted RNase H-like nuclease (RuvC/YqgF family)
MMDIVTALVDLRSSAERDVGEAHRRSAAIRVVLAEVMRLRMTLTERDAANVALRQQIDRERDEFVRLKAEIERLREAFEPVRDWYDGDGERTDLAGMVQDAVTDLIVSRGSKLP